MSGSDSIQFSVIIPTHNRPDELAGALESLRKQTHRNFEVVIVNDGQESVEGVVRNSSLAADDINIHVVQTSGNLGPSAARNAGHAAASGDVIAYLDDDDLYYPDHLATHAAQYAADGSVHVVYSDANRGVVSRDADGKSSLDVAVVHSRDYDADALMVSNYIPILCLSHRRECIVQTGGFEESLFYLEDWDLFLRLSIHWEFVHVAQVTAVYFEKGQGTSVQEENRSNFVDSLDRVYQRTEAILQETPERRERIWQMRLSHLGQMAFDTGKHLETGGDLESAAGAYARATEYAPEPEYYLSLARVQKTLGHKDKALIAMQLAQRCLELKMGS